MPPDFANNMKNDYGGSDLRQAFIHAGVPLGKSDRIDFSAKQMKLTFSASKVATDLIGSLVAERTTGQPSVRDAAEVRATLTGKICRLDGAMLNGVRLPGAVRFAPNGAASEVDPPRWREAKQYRWGVPKTGVMELRDLKGRLVLTGRLSATGKLLVASPAKATEIPVSLDF